ncbi:hypothetical protein HRR83_000048 [Exophiala dermatitidis]|uniref:FAR-17a/AIG1-like protein n=2 Tax=Exophiala dermatitidis TaxID=5970 RepID=H6C859_EXODN|nr:uncharacterized protein HMPREF1120_08254 [Exophiala dermatitidis NIH/UT8656]KAJ4523401.1 hypothetical protein HRR73_002582 [Exophiala dermatitidis]EHY60286.1 hypothetical protein HMPREF1120_08254 [Exophiala dermatitidis NIH/UT8656]KAJ4524453.1 hypothetical protein HRR75_000041 [Exophiala dermatitidis]KAJ4527297.1 hypothetical protein HRR74_000049 [Exophiala dermatitidis]KAJ4530850.1 hypothetical protein HRR76_008544 [Exophiala dermatitidis]
MRQTSVKTIFALPPVDTRSFTTSWLLPPLLLALLRLLVFSYALATQLANWIYDGTHSAARDIGREFSYFTVLTFWGILFYYLVAGVHTLVYSLRGRDWLDRWPSALQQLHSFFYTTIVTLPILVTLVYWIVLYDGPWFPVIFDGWSNVSRHALNSLFALLEIFLPATHPPPLLHLVGLIVLLLLYLALAYLTHATQHFYVYDFLDPDNGSGKVTGYCFGIAAAIIVVFGVVWLLIWLRRRFTREGKLSRHDITWRNTRTDPEMEMAADPSMSRVK